MIEIWGVDDIAYKVDDIASKMQAFAEAVRDDARLLHGPQGKGEGLKQDDIDRMLHDARAQAEAAAAADDRGRFEAQAVSEEGEVFERPEPLSLADLDAVKLAALFG
jgi:hypothetical protein